MQVPQALARTRGTPLRALQRVPGAAGEAFGSSANEAAGLLATSACILGAQEGLRLLELHPGAAGVITTNTTRFYSRNFHEFIPA